MAMGSGPYHAVVRHVDHLFHRGTAAGTGERQLLDKFLADCDKTSFEAIVARHGPAALRETIRREVARLPEKYRTPIILCYLEGLSHVEAAERLGWPVGNVRGRMARGRDLLRNRLTRRGVSWSVLATALMTASDARSSAVPQALLESTIRAASRCGKRAMLRAVASIQAPRYNASASATGDHSSYILLGRPGREVVAYG